MLILFLVHKKLLCEDIPYYCPWSFCTYMKISIFFSKQSPNIPQDVAWKMNTKYHVEYLTVEQRNDWFSVLMFG